MTSIFERMRDSIAADIHNMLDKKEEKNPIAALNQYLRQSEAETEKVRKLVERQYKLNEEFQKEYEAALEMAVKRKEQAVIALDAKEDDLYVFAKNEQREYEVRAEQLKATYENAKEQLLQLEQKYEEMKHKLKNMHMRRMELMGRENIARANYQMNKVVDGAGDKSYSKFTEMERYIEGLESKVNRVYYENTFDSKIANLERQLKDKNTVAENQ
ncbi:MAG: PspA/IM30 family protein [Bacillus sp. (in: Bacteria)]|nr:PspA/IM30 family protein [Bacillus sp. (in: firmicutes)]